MQQQVSQIHDTFIFWGEQDLSNPTPHLHCSMENTRAQFVEEVVRLGVGPPNATFSPPKK